MRLIDADALKELFSEVIGRIAKKPEMNGNLEHMIRASAMVIQMIDDAPSVQPERQWISCSERLPENDDDVLVQMNDGSMMVDCRAASSNGWFWAELGDEPVAWMPLPEPYQEGEQE